MRLTLSYFGAKLRLVVYLCAFFWETACCESYPSAPPNLLKVQGLLLWTSCVVLRVPKATSLISIHLHQHSLSPNQCMWSVVVVTAMVASTVAPVWLGDDKLRQKIFVFSKTSLCSLMGSSRDHRIPNSASHHFYKIIFLKNKQKKSLFRYVFYISKTFIVLKNRRLLWWHLFLCRICWSKNYKEGLNDLTVFYLCLVIQKLAVYLNWMTEVYAFCAYVYLSVHFVSVCMSDWHDGLYCQLN